MAKRKAAKKAGRKSSKKTSRKKSRKSSRKATRKPKPLPKSIPTKNKTHAGKIFVGCMFLGIGLGTLYGRPEVGTMLGMGVGFLVAAYIKNKVQ